MRVISSSAEETKALGKRFSRVLRKSDVVLLEGPLGVGKTVFIKGILQGLGFKENDIVSPSFTIVREHIRKGTKVYHIDLYRLERKEELFTLGYQHYFYAPQGIAVIEWGERVEEMIPAYFCLELSFSGFSRRIITFAQRGYSVDRLSSFSGKAKRGARIYR